VQAEDGGAMFLRNVGCYTTDYTASYPRRRYSSSPSLLVDHLAACLLVSFSDNINAESILQQIKS
jgi:hypothetical protein